MNNRLKNCPVCNSALKISEYHCPNCQTTIRGNFSTGKLDLLNVRQQEFVITFLCCQGNIKEVEKELKISYPTVKNRLAEINKKLCAKKGNKEKKGALSAIEALENGSVSVEEAIELITRR